MNILKIYCNKCLILRLLHYYINVNSSILKKKKSHLIQLDIKLLSK